MGTTLDHGIYLPDEGERNCYDGLAGNWVALDNHLGSTDIHVTINDKQAWDGHVADTTIHVTSADKQAWDGHVADSVKHVTAADKAKWDAVTSKANDSDVVHKSGNEYITNTKTFGNGTLIVDNTTSNVHGEIKLIGSRTGYIVADNSFDGVFDSSSCGISILLQDAGKPLHIGGYKVDSNGRVFADKTNKNPVLFITGNSVGSSTLVPVDETLNIKTFKILSRIDYANGNTSKLLDIRFILYDNANASSAIYSNDDGKTSLGIAAKRWSDVRTYKVNNLEPSSLSLPSDRSARIDISSYFTNTGTGDTNSYTAPANGYINLQLTDLIAVHCFSSTSNNLTNYCQTFSRASDGMIYVLFPVRKDDVFKATWYTSTTVNVGGAFFIPCQGNV